MKSSQLKQYLEAVQAIEPLHSWEQAALLERKEWDPAARERLQLGYLHRVIAIARKMSLSAPLLDVIHEGNVGLALAIMKYRQGDLPAYIDHFVRRAIRRRFGSE